MPVYRRNRPDSNRLLDLSVLPAPSAGDGELGSISYLELIDTPSTWGNPGEVPVINSSGNALEWIAGGVGVNLFIDLVDTPATWGNPGQILEVNGTGDALVWVDKPTGGGGGVDEFVELIDTPADYIGSAGLFVAVKQDETGLEFVPGDQIWEVDGGVADTIFYIPNNDLAIDAGDAATIFNIP